MTRVYGFLHQLVWSKPYSNPPDGQPRVLVEVFLPYEQEGSNRTPAEISALWRPGCGYSHSITAITDLPKKLAPEILARIRQKRLRRRVEAKYPLFADEIYEQERARNPMYYEGITDPQLEADREEAEAEYREKLEKLGIVP